LVARFSPEREPEYSRQGAVDRSLGRRTPARKYRFGDPRVQALLSALLLFAWQPEGVRNRHLRPLLAQSLEVGENQITQGKMSYDLRRLRLHGIIERMEGTHRYRLAPPG
jgi:hypothetical protein